jgi:hypothetical protein
MDDDLRQRKVWVSPALKDAIFTHWRGQKKFSSESDFGRSIILDITADGIDEERLAGYDQPGSASIRIWVDDANWDDAAAKAAALGLSLHSVIRRMILKEIGAKQ